MARTRSFAKHFMFCSEKLLDPTEMSYLAVITPKSPQKVESLDAYPFIQITYKNIKYSIIMQYNTVPVYKYIYIYMTPTNNPHKLPQSLAV
jgi:hypothetical protein